jgi:hypothetical protein
VNCISAAFYALTCFDGELFPPEEAEVINGMLFQQRAKGEDAATRQRNYKVRPCAAPATTLPAEDAAEIKAHIIGLYRQFLADGKAARRWEDPLLHFMLQMPGK